MADAIELMSAGLGLGQHAIALPALDKIGVQISAWLLRRGNLVNHLFRLRAHFRERPGLESKPNRFHPLINVGVGIERTTLRSARLSLETEEVIHPAVLQQLHTHAGNARVDVGLPALRPKTGGDGHRPDRHALQLGVGRFLGRDNAALRPVGIESGMSRGWSGIDLGRW
jgi:hypothetical protein